MSDPSVDRLAHRVAVDPHFLAHPLAAWAERMRLDDVAAANMLGCPVEQLVHLRLCPAPGDRRRSDAIAAKFGAAASVLASACGLAGPTQAERRYAARLVWADQLPCGGEWVWPEPKMVSALHDAHWPTMGETIRAKQGGGRKVTVDERIVTVPRAWIERLAGVLGLPAGDLIRAELE